MSAFKKKRRWYIKGGYDNFLQAYKDADVNPSKVARKLLVYPYTND